MADIDIERAENLMKSAGISLTSVINGSDSRTHAARRKRAKVLLSNHRTKIDLLW